MAGGLEDALDLRNIEKEFAIPAWKLSWHLIDPTDLQSNGKRFCCTLHAGPPGAWSLW